MILLTPYEVQQMLKISRTCVYAWMKSGRIPTIRMGGRLLRIPKDELEKAFGLIGGEEN